jgi:hypothetical protein
MAAKQLAIVTINADVIPRIGWHFWTFIPVPKVAADNSIRFDDAVGRR